MSDALPNEIVQAIAISNAKSIGEQPAILANMALANQIFNNNLATQAFINQQQAMYQIMLATLAKGISVILSDSANGGASSAQQSQEIVAELKRQFNEIQTSIQEISKSNVDLAAKFAEQLKQSQAKSE